MTRIDGPGQINRLTKVDNKKTTKKTNQKAQDKILRNKKDFKQLEQKVKKLVADKNLPKSSIREIVLREMVLWQFGEKSITNLNMKEAMNSLNTAAETVPEFKNLIDTFVNKNSK